MPNQTLSPPPLLWENTTAILQKYSRLYPEMNCFINKKFSNTVNEISKIVPELHNLLIIYNI